MAYNLGEWALLDIETTGVDPAHDDIIDVGFLYFSDRKLVRKYSSLVYTEHSLSQFIQQLTGITPEMVRRAPHWREVEVEVQELADATLIAHNAEFEASFLNSSLTKVGGSRQENFFIDSLWPLAFVFPASKNLKLESFITEWQLAEHEEHRGLADSVDLLKVLLIAALYVQKNSEVQNQLCYLFEKYNLTQHWWFLFFQLTEEELVEIANQIEFNLCEHYLSIEQLFIENQSPHFVVNKRSGVPFNGEGITKIFQDEELIKTVLPHYRFRQSQLSLALKVGQSFQHRVHALVQAPTGTGKTLGYFLPAMLYAKEGHGPVLVATGTKTLQHQAFNKDLPVARAILGLPEEEFKVVKLIGSSNHYCQLHFEQLQKEVDMLLAQEESYKFASIYLEMIFFYNQQVKQSRRITRADLSYALKMKNSILKEFEQRSAVDYKSCLGHKCDLRHSCSYFQGVKEAKEADLIIGNHALMYSWPSSFARPAYVIVDEAHRLEQETTSAFTEEVTQEQILSLLKNLQRSQGVGALFYLLNQRAEEPEKLIGEIQQLITENLTVLAELLPQLVDDFVTYFKQRPRYSSLYWNEVEMFKDNCSALELSIVNRLRSLESLLFDIFKILAQAWEPFDLSSLDNENEITAFNRFEQFFSTLDDITAGISRALACNSDDACSIAFHEREGFALRSAPIDVGKIVFEQLLGPSASVVMTSATLGGIDGKGSKGIEWATGYLHLEGKRRFKGPFYLPSVYDYTNRAMVYLATDVPAMYEKDYVTTVLAPVVDLIKSIRGRSLVLFSSRVRFEQAREFLFAHLQGELQLFVQGMGNNVVDEFKQNSRAVLLGMESFGEGIDIPGDALQFIFIDKIPDLRMDLVIRKRQDFFERIIGNSFVEYNLTTRARALHQKLGRLLRTEQDVGGVLICDARPGRWKGRTQEQFNQLMNPYKLEYQSLNESCTKLKEFILQHQLD